MTNVENFNQKYLKGVLMIATLWLAYITLVVSWISGSNLSPQIISYFFAQPVDPIISQMINYSITFARAVANMLAALVLIRLGVKFSSVIALIMLAFCLVAIVMPNYWFYTLARMIMGLGGSMLVIYINTLIYHYIPKKQQIIFNGFNTASYNIGALIVAVCFSLWGDFLILDWQKSLLMFGVSSLVLLCLWLFVAENFKFTKKEAMVEDKSATYLAVIKTKFMWQYISVFTGFIFLYVFALTSLPILLQVNFFLKSYLVIFTLAGGGILGNIAGIFLGRLAIARKRILYICGFFMIIFMALALVNITNLNFFLIYTFLTLSGFFMCLQYPIFVNIAYEQKSMSAKKLSIVIGYMWGFSYGFYTILSITWSIVLKTLGLDIALIFYIFISAVLYSVLYFLPETHIKDHKNYGL